MSTPLLQVRNLKTYFYVDETVVKAVDGVDFEMYDGETLGIVGESGSGKSVTSLSIMRLINDPPGKIINGETIFRGENLLRKSSSQMRTIRGNEISMIFQEPTTSLSPVYTVGEQIKEAIMLHQRKNRKEAIQLAIEMLKKVEIPLPERRVHEYPHQLSGGMRQRIMIAIALSCQPKLLIADEPTTAVDVTVQAQILKLMKKLQKEQGTAIIMITHNLGVIAEVSDRVMVMYGGKVVEYTEVRTLFKCPQHPYTRGLLNSIPKLTEQKRLMGIEGVVPDLSNLPTGCSFHPRCKFANDKCRTEGPELEETDKGHYVRCWHYGCI